MFLFDYEAVVWRGEVFCADCLPGGVDELGDDVSPIFADAEWETVPICVVCGERHDYITILEPENAD